MRVAQVGLAVGPIITEQPQSRSICPGATATLTVRASGASSYQWEPSTDGAGWNPISGANASTLAATPSTTAYYRAVTSNAAGATTSDIATLTPVALAAEPATNILYGDVTKDGAVTSADATVLRAVLAGNQLLAVPSAVADLNGDTRVDALDLALVTAYATSTITCLPQFPRTIATSASTAPVVATVASLTPVATQTSLNPTQYFFYTPEMSLLSHTTIQSGGGTPVIETDYIWFAGLPVAQESPAAPETRFTFADHLGTPFLQTTGTGTPTWHVEYDPYGTVYRTRTGTLSDQRLRFPGQEYDEQTPERAYNIFRGTDLAGGATRRRILRVFWRRESLSLRWREPVAVRRSEGVVQRDAAECAGVGEDQQGDF